jgi:hypothetical protein
MLIVIGLAIGAAASVAGGLLSKGPKLPKFKKVDQTAEQGKAISSNLQNFGKAKELADMSSEADQDRLESIISRTIPGYKDLISSGSKAIGNLIGGNIPNQDRDQIARRSAEQGSALGLSGSAGGRNLSARDLGLTRLQMTTQGLNQLNPFLSTVRSTSTVNPMATSSSFISPEQRIQNEMQQNQFQFQSDTQGAISKSENSGRNKFAGMLSTVGGMVAGGGANKLIGSIFGSTGKGAGSAGTPPLLARRGNRPAPGTAGPSF